MKRVILAVAVATLAAQYSATGVLDARQPTPAPLQFFKNYFVTGDYVVGGVGMNGNGNGTINISGVPDDAEVVAAFLYWQVVDKNNVGALAGGLGVTFRGHELENEDGALNKLLTAGTPACSSGGGGASGSGTTYTYRADVLAYLAIAEPPPAGNGKTIANGPHEVTLPNGQGLDALGASLVLVYARSELDTPLSAVVIYDGAFTSSTTNQMAMSLNIGGFYDASTSAKLSLMVGGGQTNPSEVLAYNGAPIATNPFTAARAAQWDNPTFNLTANPTLETVNVTVDQGPASSTWGCLTYAGTVYRTTVKDRDGDGLFDRQEDSPAPILDPYGRTLPNLNAMGADGDVKDAFIEIGFFDTDIDDNGTLDSLSYGGVPGGPPAVVHPGHTHKPPPAALKLMGDAFADKAADGTRLHRHEPINVHFDMGPGYAAGVAAPYVIPAALARGGDRIRESVTVCTPTPDPVTGLTSVWDCQFRFHWGTVGWKTGFQYLRDQLMSPTPPPSPLPPDWVDPCELPGSTCERRFDAVRKQSFRYALFAHAVGLAQSWAACVDSGGGLHYDDENGHCAAGQTVNPAFLTPRTTSGVADYPGGDLLVALGGFLNLSGHPVGTDFQIAGTLMHEFGHTAERRHGGEPFEQNCKPTYFSVMNYLYQLRGLLDDAGTPHLDYSSGRGNIVSEFPLPGLASQLYRMGWYAPLATSYLAGKVQAAKSYCNGAPYPTTGPTAPVPMVRVDAATVAGAIDWDANNSAGQLYPAQDVNFNGFLDNNSVAGFPSLTDSDDWSALRLNQVAIRRNVGVRFRIPGTLEFAIGPSSLDLGKTEPGKTEPGKTEPGKTEPGKTEPGANQTDLGKTEPGAFGKTEPGSGDNGHGPFGSGDDFRNDPFNPGGEIDSNYEVNLAPPYEFKACVIGDCTLAGAPTTPFHRVWNTFKAVGGATSYIVYRANGTTLTQGLPWTQVAIIPVVRWSGASYFVVDPTELVQGQPYLYFAVSVHPGGVSEHSNVIPIIGKNDPPVAGVDAYSVNEDSTLNVAAPGVLANDVDPDSSGSATTAQVVTGPAHGTLALNANGSFTYTPAANYFGADSFTYRSTFGASLLTGTANITVNPVNDAPSFVKGANQSVGQGSGAQTVAGWATAISAGPLNEGGQTVTFEVTNNSNSGIFAAQPMVAADGRLSYTPSPSTSGSATITLRITDNGGTANGGVNTSATQAFTITVVGPATFFGIQNAPPPSNKTFKAGSSIPMKWSYNRAGVAVASGTASQMVTVTGPGGVSDSYSCTFPPPGGAATCTDPGSSYFKYDTLTKQWSFNLQTKQPNGTAYPSPATYTVRIVTTTPGFVGSGDLLIKLVK